MYVQVHAGTSCLAESEYMFKYKKGLSLLCSVQVALSCSMDICKYFGAATSSKGSSLESGSEVAPSSKRPCTSSSSSQSKQHREKSLLVSSQRHYNKNGKANFLGWNTKKMTKVLSASLQEMEKINSENWWSMDHETI